MCGPIYVVILYVAQCLDLDKKHPFYNSSRHQIGDISVDESFVICFTEQLTVAALGFDLATINAIEVIDTSCIASANQLGQLNIWDLRSPNTSKLSQKRIVPYEILV